MADADIIDLAEEQAQRRWPAVKVDRAALAEHIDRLVRARGCAPRAEHAGDIALACACARGDRAALAVLEQELLSRVPSYLARLAGPSTLADDVRQELRQKLLVAEKGAPKILDYAGDGSIQGWLRVGAIRTALKMLRSQHERRPETAEAIAVTSPELELVRSRHRADFEQAVRDAFRALSPAERTLLRLRFVDGLELEALATLHQTHRSTVVRKLAAARRRMLDEVRRALRETSLTPSEIRSLIVLLRSDLDITLRTTGA